MATTEEKNVKNVNVGDVTHVFGLSAGTKMVMKPVAEFATAAQGAKADTALQDASQFATAAQGAKADTALQDDILPSLATAAQGAKADTAVQPDELNDTLDALIPSFATAAQGAKADTALQPAILPSLATAAQGAKADTALQDASQFATAAQGAKADTAVQPGVLIGYATAAQGAKADTAMQPGERGQFSTEAAFVAANISLVVTAVFIAGYYTPGDDGAHWKIRVAEPAIIEAWHKQSGDGAWWEISPDGAMRPEMLGVRPHIVCEPETKAWYNNLSSDIAYCHLAWMDLFIYLLKARNLWNDATYMLMPSQNTAANGRVNIRNPGVGNAAAFGGLVHLPGFGIKGDGVSGYMSLPTISSLFGVDKGAVALLFEAGTLNGNLVANSAGGTTGLGINPGSIASGNASFRFLSDTLALYARGGLRKDLMILSRPDNTGFKYYSEGELVTSVVNAGATLLANPIYLFRSGSAYQNDTIRFFMTFNKDLTSQQADELSCLIEMFSNGMGGVVNRGPMCADIGFDAYNTSAEIRTALNQCAMFSSKSSQKTKVVLGMGTYLINGDYHGFKTGVETMGVDKFGSILRPDVTVDKETPIVSPGHFNGGEHSFSIHGFTVHCAAITRGVLDIGELRPGGSGLSTNGSRDGEIYSMCILDPVLHNIDYCNTGELTAAGTDRRYCQSPLPTKRRVGIASLNIRIWDIITFNAGDDHITAHYAGGGHRGFIQDTEHYFASGRHPDGPRVTMGVEIDDGSWHFNVKRVYARSLARAAAAKSHGGNPAPIDCTFEQIVSERCGQGVLFYDPNDAGIGNNVLDGLTFKRPFEVQPGTYDVSAYVTSGMTGTRAYDLDISCRGDEDFLAAAILSESASEDPLVDGFTVTNWKSAVDLVGEVIKQGETVRVTSSTVDAKIRNGRIIGGGRYGVWDSGSLRPDYENISINGAGVEASVGFRVSANNDMTYRAIKDAGGYTTPISIT